MIPFAWAELSSGILVGMAWVCLEDIADRYGWQGLLEKSWSFPEKACRKPHIGSLPRRCLPCANFCLLINHGARSFNRQHYGEGSAFPRLALDSDFPLMLFNDAIADRQT